MSSSSKVNSTKQVVMISLKNYDDDEEEEDNFITTFNDIPKYTNNALMDFSNDGDDNKGDNTDIEILNNMNIDVSNCGKRRLSSDMNNDDDSQDQEPKLKKRKICIDENNDKTEFDDKIMKEETNLNFVNTNEAIKSLKKELQSNSFLQDYTIFVNNNNNDTSELGSGSFGAVHIAKCKKQIIYLLLKLQTILIKKNQQKLKFFNRVIIQI